VAGDAAQEQRFRLDGMTALVLGASRGIGRACALALASAGADLVLASRSADELGGVAAESERDGARPRALTCDVACAASIEQLFDAAGELDVLVHCVGINRPAPIVDMPLADLDAMLSLNVRSAYLAGQAAARAMTAQGRGGSIVFVSSQMGHVGAARRTAYCATKHAVEGLAKAMAVELGPAGIRVNTVAPTFVETAMTAPFLADPGFRADVLGRIPLGRLGSVDDVASAVVFAASSASALMTGSSVVVDGGWTAQ